MNLIEHEIMRKTKMRRECASGALHDCVDGGRKHRDWLGLNIMVVY